MASILPTNYTNFHLAASHISSSSVQASLRLKEEHVIAHQKDLFAIATIIFDYIKNDSIHLPSPTVFLIKDFFRFILQGQDNQYYERSRAIAHEFLYDFQLEKINRVIKNCPDCRHISWVPFVQLIMQNIRGIQQNGANYQGRPITVGSFQNSLNVKLGDLQYVFFGEIHNNPTMRAFHTICMHYLCKRRSVIVYSESSRYTAMTMIDTMMLPKDVCYETWDTNYMLDPRSIRLETLKNIFQRQLELGIRLATQSQHQQEIYHDISQSLIELGTCMSKDTNRETEPFQNLTSLIKNWTERRASSIEDTIIDHSSILIAFSQYQCTQDRFIYTDEFEARQRSLIHTMEAHKEHHLEKLAIFLLGRAHIFTETTDSLSS